VEVRARQGLDKVRKVWSVLGFGPQRTITAHNNDEPNLLRGLVERLYLVQGAQGLEPTPRPQPAVFAARLREFRLRLRRTLPLCAPVSTDTFVGFYAGKQRAVYQKAATSLEAVPVRRDDAQVQTFVKAEKIDLRSKPDPVPRLIQPRSPRYNVAVGRYLRPIEKLVYRGIAKVWGGPTVLKLNALEQGRELRAMWDSFNNPVAVGLDASRFDQHVSVDALRNVGRAYVPTAVVKYVVEGARMSGDINTSMGNCLLMCAMMWAYVQSRGVRARLANNGDDCVLICDRADLPRLQEGLTQWFAEMGFTMTVEEPVYVFEHIEFCQTRPVWTPDGYLMVRTFDRAVSRDMSSLLDLASGLGAYFHAVGAGGLAAYGGIPVYQDLYRSMLRVGKPSRLELVGGMRYLARGLKRDYRVPHPKTRASFELAFGLLPDEQVCLEEFLNDYPLERTLSQVVTPFAEHWYR